MSSSCMLRTALVALFFAGATAAQDMDDKQKASYCVGIQLGKMVSNTPELIDQAALIEGLKDSIAGTESKVSEEEMQRLLQDLNVKMQAATKARLEQEGAESKTEGETFLADNGKQEGWKTTASGLQYKVITPGIGKTPAKSDTVQTHYRGTFIDGKEFDSSYKRGQPAQFGVTQVIPGWTEALLLMKEGAKWELAIPYQLAYGEAGRPPAIPPFSVLKFEIELIEIVQQP